MTIFDLTKHIYGYYHLYMLKYDITYFDKVNSTNTILKQLAAYGAQEGKVIVANCQTEGKGRNGKSFYSPEGSGVYFSVLLKPCADMEKILYLTPCMAVAVCETIEKNAGSPTGIKWVNDIFMNGKKVCGILTESGKDIYGNTFVIIGAGINLSNPPNGFPPELRNIAGSVYDNQILSDRIKENFIIEILKNLSKYYEKFTEKSFLDAYRKRSVLNGKNITVKTNNQTFSAFVLGIGDDFELLAKTSAGKIHALTSAEILSFEK